MLKPAAIRVDQDGLSRDGHLEDLPASFGERGDDRLGVIREGTGIELTWLEPNLAGAKLREIQQIRDQSLHLVSAPGDIVQ